MAIHAGFYMRSRLIDLGTGPASGSLFNSDHPVDLISAGGCPRR
jgi:hypothetical protein